MKENKQLQTIDPVLAGVAVIIGTMFVLAAVLLLWLMLTKQWNWAIFGVSTSLFFLGADLLIAGSTRKKPLAVELLSSLV